MWTFPLILGSQGKFIMAWYSDKVEQISQQAKVLMEKVLRHQPIWDSHEEKNKSKVY